MLLIYRVLYPILIFLARLVAIFNPKLKQGLKLRQKTNGKFPWLNSPENLQPIWIHCASGEYEYAKPVIRWIKQNHPQEKIIVTFFSPSVEPALAKANDIDFYTPTPWDTSHHWKKFIKHHKPKALLIARTDLWPAMLGSVNKNKIPCLLFAKTTNEKKSIGSFQKSLLRRFDDIFCVSETDQRLLQKAIHPYQNIHKAGDTRYDQCFYRLQHPRPLKNLKNFSRPIFIGGSTWPGDENWITPVIAKYKKNVSFILAPHEPSKTHLKVITTSLKKLDCPFQLYSETNNWNPESVLIIDQVGILADLYAWSDFAFVGGSVDRSVHSVMEPLAQGNRVFLGPKHHNNRESLEFLQEQIMGLSPIQVCTSARGLAQALDQSLTNWTQQHRTALQVALQNKRGASEIVGRWLNNKLKSSS